MVRILCVGSSRRLPLPAVESLKSGKIAKVEIVIVGRVVEVEEQGIT
jgi:hypothetical protein